MRLLDHGCFCHLERLAVGFRSSVSPSWLGKQADRGLNLNSMANLDNFDSCDSCTLLFLPADRPVQIICFGRWLKHSLPFAHATYYELHADTMTNQERCQLSELEER
jgi:hypothetical protein